jgi:hypothetical protein
VPITCFRQTAFQRRALRGDENDFVRTNAVRGGSGDYSMTEMNWVEGAAKKCYSFSLHKQNN